jgi:hypothetical protein
MGVAAAPRAWQSFSCPPFAISTPCWALREGRKGREQEGDGILEGNKLFAYNDVLQTSISAWRSLRSLNDDWPVSVSIDQSEGGDK